MDAVPVNDIFDAQLPMYHVERNVIELNKPFDKGVKAMCEIMQKLQDEGRAEGRAEGRTEERYSTAKRMLLFNEPIEKIVAYTSLSEECIKELAQQTHWVF